jgi:uncharacterized Zn finger protein
MTSSPRTRPARSVPRRAPLTLPAPGPLTGRGSRDIATGPWGSLWISRMEDPETDPRYDYDYGYGDGRDGRLSRARTLARRGAVGELTVRPGMIAAKVRGSRPTPYRCEIHVPELSEADWDRLVDEWAADAEQVIAELAGDRLGPHCQDAAFRARTDLVPGPGAFTYYCSCPDWGDPCKHAAALGYVYARCLDERGEALLALHGRNLADACAAVGTRFDQTARAERERQDEEAQAEAGAARDRSVPAGEAFAREAARGTAGELPPLPAPAPHHGEPATFPETGVVSESVDPVILHMLVRDTARRAADAYRHLHPASAAPGTGEESTEAGTAAVPRPARRPDTLLWLAADPWHDTVRRAAADAGEDPSLFGRLMTSSDQARTRLAPSAAAWRHGGLPALSALDAAHPPDRDSERTAREQLARVRIKGRSGPPLLRRTRGRISLVGEDVELRWGTDARWYPYTKQRGQWQPAGPPSPAAAEALRGAVPLE